MSLLNPSRGFERSIISVPDSWFHLSSSIQMVGKTLDREVEVSASNHVIYLAVLKRLFRVSSNMVATKGGLCIRADPFDVRNTLPVTFDHGSFSLNRDEIGSLLGYLVQPLVV